MKISSGLRAFTALGPPFIKVAILLGVPCATYTPASLTNARSAYRQASLGPATRYAPTELHAAKLALAKAEQSFEDVRSPQMTDTLAYAAESLAQNAAAVAAGSVAAKNGSDAAQRPADKKVDASDTRSN